MSQPPKKTSLDESNPPDSIPEEEEGEVHDEDDDDDKDLEPGNGDRADLKLSSSDESPELSKPLASKRKHSLDGKSLDSISPLDRKRIKPEIIDKVDLESLHLSQSDVPQTSNIWLNSVNSQEKKINNTGTKGTNNTSGTGSDIPIDTFITLTPLPNSIISKPIYIRQGVNPFSIGRNEACEVFINDDRMSKIHCLFNKKRHPALEMSIYESPAHCLDDIWLLDCSTNSCLVNGVNIGKNRKVQLFDGDKLEFFNDTRSFELMGFTVQIVDPTGLFNAGDRTSDMDKKFVNVLKQDQNDVRLRPRLAPESAFSEQPHQQQVQYQYQYQQFQQQQRQQSRPLEENKDTTNRNSPLSSQSQPKRADLKVGQERPANSWV